jgi:hypothetical protein
MRPGQRTGRKIGTAPWADFHHLDERIARLDAQVEPNEVL